MPRRPSSKVPRAACVEVRDESLSAFDSAQLAWREGREVDTVRYCHLMLAQHPDHDGAITLIGEVQLRQRSWYEAERWLLRALHLVPECPGVLVLRGIALHHQHRHGEALQCFDDALVLQPGNVEALSVRALPLAALGQFEEALVTLADALNREPLHAQSWYRRGALLLGRSRCADALESLSRCTLIDPESAEAWRERGCALALLDRAEEAIDCFERAAASAPDHVQLSMACGLMHLAHGQPRLALRNFEAALARDSDDTTALLLRATALTELGNHDSARTDCARAYAFEPGNPRAWHLLGIASSALGRTEEAAEALSRARRLAPALDQFTRC